MALAARGRRGRAAVSGEPGAVRERGAVLITGASTGIGRACALRLDAGGFSVFAGVRRDEDGQRLRSEASGRLEPVLVDITDDDSIEAARTMVVEQAGGALAGLVNNAGITVAGPLEFIPIEDFRRQLEVNVVGHVAVTQAMLEPLRAGRGRIVLVGSVGGRTAVPFLAPYNASKFALEAIADSLRGELRPWGIEVSLIEPGTIATPIWEKGAAQADSLAQRSPARALELYGNALVRMQAVSAERAARGLAPDVVARVVEHALTARRPRTRYLIGLEARTQVALARALPDRAWDRLIARLLKL